MMPSFAANECERSVFNSSGAKNPYITASDAEVSFGCVEFFNTQVPGGPPHPLCPISGMGPAAGAAQAPFNLAKSSDCAASGWRKRRGSGRGPASESARTPPVAGRPHCRHKQTPHSYRGSPARRSSAWKRGSECMKSNSGAVLSSITMS
jgi:hypothetical protein